MRSKTENKTDQDVRDLALDFHDAVVTLRRVARRVIRTKLPDLPSSESELLGLVGRSAGIGVNDAAKALQLSANSVSTLIKSLVARGLIVRVVDEADRRAARLHLTKSGVSRIRSIKKRRTEVLTSAMEQLSDRERMALEKALPAMRHLLTHLTSIDPAKGA